MLSESFFELLELVLAVLEAHFHLVEKLLLRALAEAVADLQYLLNVLLL